MYVQNDIRIAVKPTLFYAVARFEDKDTLKKAGFKWDANAKHWQTDSTEMLEKLLESCPNVTLSMDAYNLLTGRAHWEYTYNPDPFGGNEIEDAYLVDDVPSPSKTTGKTHPSTNDPILVALRILAGNDPDFAQQRNNIGFNGSDATIGHSLANFPYLSEKQQWRAKKILKKYNRQIPPDIYNKIFGDPDQLYCACGTPISGLDAYIGMCGDCKMASEEF